MNNEIYNDGVDAIRLLIQQPHKLEETIKRIVSLAKSSSDSIEDQVMYVQKLQISQDLPFTLGKRYFDEIYDTLDQKK